MTPLLFIAFLLVPLAEIYVIAQVGQLLGVLPTLAVLLTVSVLGAIVVKREGMRTWRQLRGAIGVGRLPGREIADAALVLVGGVLLLTPGFLTDIVGLALVLPFTRPVARRLLFAVALRRVRPRRGDRRRRSNRPGSGSSPIVIEGTVPPDPTAPSATAGPRP